MTRSAARKSSFGRKVVLALISVAVLIILVALAYASLFGPTDRFGATEQFLVTPDQTPGQIASELAAKGYIRSPWIFEIAYWRESYGHTIRPGGYEISKSMDAWTIASQLVQPPYVAWVKVRVGMRKEEIGSMLAEELGWNEAQKAEWEAATTATSPNYIEGVYFPDTYLIPTDEAPALIAQRMRDRFKEAFAPYADEALKKKVSWTRVLTIASLIQRETGTASDMPIIAGIIERRLAVGMPLAIDATLQYVTGSEENGWWPQPKSAATYPDDPFNTYKRKGLPPHPIASPGLTAIEAALNPATTNCLFYIHDLNGKMHCSATYAGQLSNVAKYLK